MSNRKRNVVAGFISSFGSSFVLQLASLLVIPIYLDLTSQDLFGLWLTLSAILGWIKIGDIGLGLSLTRRSVEALEKSDYKLLLRYTNATILGTFLFGILISSIGYALTDSLILALNISDNLENDFKSTYYILLIVAFLKPGLSVFSSVINAKQYLAFLHIKNTTITLISICLNILLLNKGFGIASFAFGLLAEALLTPIVDILYLRQKDKQIIFLQSSKVKREFISLLKFGGPYQVLKIANLVSTSTDNIIIAAILGTTSVTIYVFTGKLAFLLAIFLVSILPSILFPGFTQLFENKDFGKIRSLYFKLSNFAIRLGVFSGVCYFYINEYFIDIWVGAENFGGIELTFYFVIWIIFESFTRGITSIVYASGDLKGITFISCVEAILNISLTLILISKMGLIGVVLGTLLSRFIVVIYMPYKINKILTVNSVVFIKKLFINFMYYLFLMIFFGEIISFIFKDITHTLIQIIIICFSMFLINVLFSEGLF